MPKYKKRSDGRYATSIITGYTDNGKPKRKVLYGKTIIELEKNVADFKSLQNRGIVIDDKGITLGEWAHIWLKLYKSDKAYNTVQMYTNIVENYIIPELGAVRLSALKTYLVQTLINNIIAAGHRRTADLFLLTLRQIIKQAIIEEYIYKDVTLGVHMPERQKPVKRSLTDEEKHLIQNTDLSFKERAFIDLLYYTGIRRGEALALMASDFDLQDKTVTINKTLILKDGKSELKFSPKTAAGNRVIPLPDILIKTISSYLSDLKSLYLFTMQNGDLLTRSSFKRMWDSILNKLNISAGGDKIRFSHDNKNAAPLRMIADDITPHIFRHTYATSLYNADIDIKTAQYLLGHSSIQMTLDIYTHLDNTKINAAANRINNFFDSQNIVNG